MGRAFPPAARNLADTTRAARALRRATERAAALEAADQAQAEAAANAAGAGGPNPELGAQAGAQHGAGGGDGEGDDHFHDVEEAAADAAEQAEYEYADDDMSTPAPIKDDATTWTMFLKNKKGHNESPVSMERFRPDSDPVKFYVNLQQLWEDVRRHERVCGVTVTWTLRN